VTLKRNPILIAITALCLLALGAVVRPRTERFLAPPPVRAAAEDAPRSPDTIRCVWTTPLPLVGYRTSTLSPDGRYIGVLFNHSPGKSQERLALWRWQDRPDKPLWSRADPSASMVTVGAGGDAVLTCARFDPTRPSVTLRRGVDGASVSGKPIALDGAVWDMQMSTDGRSAAVTTGNHGLYLFPSLERSGFERFPSLGGIGNSVSLTPNNTYLTVGTWDESGVVCDTMSKIRVWQYPAETSQGPKLIDRIFETQMAQDGQYVLGMSYANAHKNDGTLYLWRCDGDGTPLWTCSLGVEASQPKAMVTQDGNAVAVSYLRLISHGSQSIAVRHLLMLDENGKTVWDVGYLMFSPTLVALAPDGHRITISDGGQTLYNLDAHGRITASNKLKGTATIRETMTTPDGHYVLVYTSDGSLSLFQIG
jgi:hypothetical protein